jgi:MFS family permease
VRLGIFFALLFTGYLSFQNVITQLYEQLDMPNLGKMSIFSIYAALMISGLFAPFIAKRVNYKTLLVTSSILYTLNFSSGIVLHYTNSTTLITIIVEVLAVSGGFGGGILWVSQAGYIHYICEKNNMQHKKGYYFGVFYGVYSVSNITSGLVTTFMLGLFEVTVYFWILLGIGILATIFCIFCITDVQTKYADRQSNDS